MPELRTSVKSGDKAKCNKAQWRHRTSNMEPSKNVGTAGDTGDEVAPQKTKRYDYILGDGHVKRILIFKVSCYLYT